MMVTASRMIRSTNSAHDGGSSIAPATCPDAITPRSVRPSNTAALSSIGVFAVSSTWPQISCRLPCLSERPSRIICGQVRPESLRNSDAGPRPVRLAFLDLLGLGLLGLRTRKLRAALSALGISIGVATMVVVTGISASSHQALMNEMSALGSNMLRVQPFSGQAVPVELPEESVDMVRRIKPVTEASAVANTHAVVQRSDLIGEDDFSSTGLSVLAARRDLLSVVGGKVFSGRFFSGTDEQFPTAVLGYRAASQLGIGEIPENDPAPQMQIDKSWFTVIGILHSLPLADDLDNAVLTGWPAAKKTLRFEGNPTVIYVKAREAHLEDVRSVLPATVFPEQPGQVQVSRPSDALAAKRATQNNRRGHTRERSLRRTALIRQADRPEIFVGVAGRGRAFQPVGARGCVVEVGRRAGVRPRQRGGRTWQRCSRRPGPGKAGHSGRGRPWTAGTACRVRRTRWRRGSCSWASAVASRPICVSSGQDPQPATGQVLRRPDRQHTSDIDTNLAHSGGRAECPVCVPR